MARTAEQDLYERMLVKDMCDRAIAAGKLVPVVLDYGFSRATRHRVRSACAYALKRNGIDTKKV